MNVHGVGIQAFGAGRRAAHQRNCKQRASRVGRQTLVWCGTGTTTMWRDDHTTTPRRWWSSRVSTPPVVVGQVAQGLQAWRGMDTTAIRSASTDLLEAALGALGAERAVLLDVYGPCPRLRELDADIATIREEVDRRKKAVTNWKGGVLRCDPYFHGNPINPRLTSGHYGRPMSKARLERERIQSDKED